MTRTTTIADSNNHDLINLLALSATAGTLRRVYDASGNDMIRELRNGLQLDTRALAKLADCINRATTLEINDNTGLYNTIVIDKSANAAVNTMINDDTITDAYDPYMVAYEYLWEQMIVNDRACDDMVTITLKDGTTKERTIYQCACMAVRREIYANKSIDATGKYLYIEDMRSGADDNSADALDREYIRLGKYYDLGGACHSGDINSSLDSVYSADHETVDSTNALMASLNLTDRQALVVHYRRQGFSVSAIAEKLNVSQQAISKTLAQVQDKVKTQRPELVRSHRVDRISKAGRAETNSAAAYSSDYIPSVIVPDNATTAARYTSAIDALAAALSDAIAAATSAPIRDIRMPAETVINRGGIASHNSIDALAAAELHYKLIGIADYYDMLNSSRLVETVTRYTLDNPNGMDVLRISYC